MRKLLLSACLSLGFVGLGLAQNRLVAYQHLGTRTKADVQQTLDNFGVPAGFIRPEFDVDIYKIHYITQNAQNTDTTTASGAIVVPVTNGCPLPLVAYHHGTTTERQGVPSYGSDELQLGVIFASANGFVATLPDYLGLGDSRGFHPYVHAQTEASASIDLLRTARELTDSLSYQLNGQLFLFGYSQGGHAAMATFKTIEEQLSGEFTVTAAAPMSGPYDLSGIQAQTITNGQPYSSPSYLPYVILGYQEVYGDLYSSLSDVFVPPYDSMIPIWYNGSRSAGYIDNRLPNVISQMLQPAVYNDYLNNPNHIIRQHLRESDVYNWTPVAPLRMLYCRGDEQVFYQNSEIAYDTMVANGAQQVEKYDHGNYDHFGCLQFCMLDGNNFFARYKNLLNGLQYTANINNVSADGQADGAASIQIQGGQAPYTYQWSNGASGSSVSGLARGAYSVRISDARGCFGYQNVVVGLPNGVEHSQEAANWFQISPNPNDGRLVLQQLPLEPAQISAYDQLGRLVWREATAGTAQLSLDFSQWEAGTYYLIFQSNKQTQHRRLVISQ